jgi:hypothetical protein
MGGVWKSGAGIMSSAGVIAHSLGTASASGVWIYEQQVGDANSVTGADVVWDPVRERFFCLLTQMDEGTSILISSPDGRAPWRLDHTFTEYYQYSSEPARLVVHPSGRLVTCVTQGNSGGNTVGAYFLYSDNLTDWYPSSTLATGLSKDDYLIFNGYRYMSFSLASTTAIRTTDATLTTVQSCDPPSTSGDLNAVLVWDNGGLTDKRVILAVGGNAGFSLNSKIVYTDDGGTTWNTSTLNAAEPSPQTAFTGLVTDGTTIRAYKTNSGSLYRYDSTDGGLSFTPFAVSSGTSSTTPAGMLNYYDSTWWGPGRDSGTPVTVKPQVLTSATGLRPFTRSDITQWPELWPGQVRRIAHNERISVAFGLSSGSGTSNNGWLAYRYRT